MPKSKYPVGTVLHRAYPELGAEHFDVTVRLHTGWLLIDQHGVYPHVQPACDAEYTDITPKVSEG